MTILRHRPGRVLAVTLGLAVAGAVFGGVAGAIALVISLMLTREFSFLADARLYAVAGTLGAILGAVAAPLTGWLLLRYVPLGRAFAGLTVGAVVGGVIGWFLPRSIANGDALLIAAALGALCAAVVMRVRHARALSSPVSGADDP
jgi:hypothetical protein